MEWDASVPPDGYLRDSFGANRIICNHPHVDKITTRGILNTKWVKGQAEIEMAVKIHFKDGTEKEICNDHTFDKSNIYLNQITR